MKDFALGFIAISIAIAIFTGIMFGLLVAWANIRVYTQEKRGEADFVEARQNRKIQIEEAEANLEAEILNAKAEVERAKGAAEAIDIEGGKLTENYIRYLWIRQLNTGEKQLIYVPTEAGLPLLEASRK